MKIETGGKAFPELKSLTHITPAILEAKSFGGMTLRDYFAAKAMPALIAVAAATNRLDPEFVAADAYTLADALIKARRANKEVRRKEPCSECDNSGEDEAGGACWVCDGTRWVDGDAE